MFICRKCRTIYKMLQVAYIVLKYLRSQRVCYNIQQGLSFSLQIPVSNSHISVYNLIVILLYM